MNYNACFCARSKISLLSVYPQTMQAVFTLQKQWYVASIGECSLS